MVSPEVLRRYPFFGFMNHDQLREVAIITDEMDADADTTLFESGAEADTFYLLRDGNVELHYVVTDERGMEKRQDFLVGMINPGEVVGISALISPYKYTAMAVVTEPSELLRVDAKRLRDLCDTDPTLSAAWHQRMAESTMERLHSTRVQLLAAT